MTIHQIKSIDLTLSRVWRYHDWKLWKRMSKWTYKKKGKRRHISIPENVIRLTPAVSLSLVRPPSPNHQSRIKPQTTLCILLHIAVWKRSISRPYPKIKPNQAMRFLLSSPWQHHGIVRKGFAKFMGHPLFSEKGNLWGESGFCIGQMFTALQWGDP